MTGPLTPFASSEPVLNAHNHTWRISLVLAALSLQSCIALYKVHRLLLAPDRCTIVLPAAVAAAVAAAAAAAAVAAAATVHMTMQPFPSSFSCKCPTLFAEVCTAVFVRPSPFLCLLRCVRFTCLTGIGTVSAIKEQNTAPTQLHHSFLFTTNLLSHLCRLLIMRQICRPIHLHACTPLYMCGLVHCCVLFIYVAVCIAVIVQALPPL